MFKEQENRMSKAREEAYQKGVDDGVKFAIITTLVTLDIVSFTSDVFYGIDKFTVDSIREAIEDAWEEELKEQESMT